MVLYFDNILIKPIQQEDNGILFMPDYMKQKPNKGLVLQVGTGKPNKPMMYKPQDEVYYRNGSPTEIEIKGETLLLIKQSDILFKI
ncbi:MAG TPA: co-chaperone GroES [Bacilli bacterium]|nr:co-chaperone GroES [Bacilli bacterium]